MPDWAIPDGMVSEPMTSPSLQSLLADPAWLPHTFDRAGQRLLFVRLTREQRDKLPFLAQEYVGKDYPTEIRPWPEIAKAEPVADAGPLHFIFHTSFCCSTLLTRALASPGIAADLREPDILMNLGNRLLHESSGENLRRLDFALCLLARPFEPTEAVIVKPSNFANNLIDPILECRPFVKAILLYADLESFLRSIAKKGMWGRLWVRKLYLQCAAWHDLQFGFGDREMFELSDLQVAGLAWLIQISHFERLTQVHGADRLMPLHSQILLDRREEMLSKASRFLSLGHDVESISRIAMGQVFQRDSKSAQSFDVKDRAEEHARAGQIHGEEIQMVAIWIRKIAAEKGIRSTMLDSNGSSGG
jgi:hypothetical protein